MKRIILFISFLFISFLCYLLFPNILNVQAKGKQIISSTTTSPISISIRPGSESGSLNIRFQSCPEDNFDFRTCEGVISASKTVGGLFQVKLPPIFGDGHKSWKKEDDILSYSWPFPEGITVKVVVQPVADGLQLAYTLENTSSVFLDSVLLHPCIPTTEAPGFNPEPTIRDGKKNWAELYERLSLWTGGRRFSFAESSLADSQVHLAFMFHEAKSIHWAWWVNSSETFDLPLIALASRDRSHTVALAFEKAIWTSSNVGDDRACFHLFPWFGRIEPGKSVTVHGKLYFLNGGPEVAFEHFRHDFPDI